MGLGYTSGTRTVIAELGWAKVDLAEKYGDCLEFAVDVADHIKRKCGPANVKFEPVGSDGKWERLVPIEWNLEALETDGRESAKADVDDDYAVIVRHTQPAGVIFICAGFTDRSTERAAKYLAKKYDLLYSKAKELRGAPDTGRYGSEDIDFLCVLTGKYHAPSDWQGPTIFLTPSQVKNQIRQTSPGAKQPVTYA
jgi:hypothetical protein